MDAAVRDLAVAFAHFGVEKRAQLRWLLDFVDRDLTTKEAAADAAKQATIVSFAARMGGVGPRAAAVMGRLSGKALDLPLLRAAPAAVERAQRAVRQALAAFAADGRCTLPFKIVGWERLPDGRVLPLVGGEGWSRFYGAVFMLVVELGPDLRVCANPKCRKLFLRSKRQTYCGPRCSQRERTHRFREKNPRRVSEARHATYVRQQRKRLGSRVKVRRGRQSAVSKHGK